MAMQNLMRLGVPLRAQGGVSFSPTDLEGLQLWLDASDAATLFQDSAMTTPAAPGDPIGGWADKSGTDNHATQATAENRPSLAGTAINDMPCLSFGGSHDLNVAATIISSSQRQVSAFVVVLVEHFSSRQFIWSSASSSNYRWGMSISDAYLLASRAYIAGAYLSGYNARSPAESAHIVASIAGDTMGHYVDGLAGYTEQSVFVSAVRHHTLGSVNHADYFTGKIAEVIAYSNALSDADRKRVEHYLSKKWGVGLSYNTAPNAFTYLRIPSTLSNNRTTHPDVLYFPNKWPDGDGYHYWMAHTPYPGTQNENPCIAVSNDGEEWIEPPGITNPVVPAPPSGYNSDPDLVVAPDNTMWLFYRTLDGHEYLYVKSSSDGVSWSDPALILDTETTTVSPSVLWDGAQYVMWTVSSGVIYRRTSSAPDGTWSERQACSLALPEGVVAWHIHVSLAGGIYHLLVNEYAGSLYYATSGDGLSWQYQRLLLSPTKTGWDQTKIYRAASLIDGNVMTVFYSAHNRSVRWHIGKATFSLT